MSAFASTSIYRAPRVGSSFKAAGALPTSISIAALADHSFAIRTRPSTEARSLRLRPLLKAGVPFSQVHIADNVQERCSAAQTRLLNLGARLTADVGAADATVDKIKGRLNPHGLHFAFLDPYNLNDLPFSVFEALASLKRIDLLIHVSAQDLQRNLDAYSQSGNSPLDRFAPGWRAAVDLNQTQAATRAAFVSYWVSKMETLDLPPGRHAELVSGTTKNQRFYWLVFASRSDFAKSLWDKIRNVSGQGELL